MIDKLPDLPFRLVLKKLSHEDRFSLRRTCKRLKGLVDGQVCQNLFVFLDSYPCHEYLFYTNELVYYSDSCRIPQFDRFISSNYKENLKLIRKLTIFFQSLYILEDYPTKVKMNVKLLEKENFFQEVWRLQINLKHLNFFEQVEHLEIKRVGRVFGKLKLNNLKILSVETRRLSEFDLDCDQLKAMRISFGARPNFIGHLPELDCLSTGLLLFEGTYDYLLKLFRKCPKLSTFGFEHPDFLRFTLLEVNAGRIHLPLWRVIKFEKFGYFLCDQMIDCLTEYEKSIEPERLRIILNGEPMSLEQLVAIQQVQTKLSMAPDKSSVAYLNFLKENQGPTDCSCLLLGLSQLDLSKKHIELDKELVVKLKNLNLLSFLPGTPPIGEAVFRRMLTTWNQLDELRFYRPGEVVGQHLLEQMPGYWPNLHSLFFLCEKPEDLKFVAEFRNLKVLGIAENLPREETEFLLRACRSLRFILLKNESTDLLLFLRARNSWKYVPRFRVFSKARYISFNRYSIGQVKDEADRKAYYYCRFDSLEKLLDDYYEKDLFNNRTPLSRMDQTKKKHKLFWLLP